MSFAAVVRAKLPPAGNPYTLGRPGLIYEKTFRLASGFQNSSGSGRVQWSSGAPVQNPQSGPVFRPQNAGQAVRAKLPPAGNPYTLGRPGLVYKSSFQPPPASTWSVLQSAFTDNAGGTGLTITATLGRPLTSGTKLIAVVNIAQAANISSVKDGGGNTFSTLATVTSVNGNDTIILCLDHPNSSSTAITLTVTGTDNGLGLLVQEVSGLAAGATTAAVWDGTAGTASGGGISSPFSATLGAYSSSVTNEYLTAFYSDDGDSSGTGPVTTPGGYTADAHNKSGDANSDISVFYKNSTGGSESPSSLSVTAGASSGCDYGTVFVAWKLAARGPQSYASGRVQWNSGVLQNTTGGTGPVFTQSPRALQAKLPRPQFFPRGRVSSNPGAKPSAVAPPPVYPLQGPVRAKIRQNAPRGTCRAIRFYPGPQNPQPGPVFYPATKPIQARIPQNAPRGRIYSNPGAKVTVLAPPPVYPLQGPVRAKLPQQPLLRGRIYSNHGAPVQNPQSGPVFRPQNAGQAKLPRPQFFPRGRVSSNPGAKPSAVAPPPVYPLRGPVRAKLPPAGNPYTLGRPGLVYERSSGGQLTTSPGWKVLQSASNDVQANTTCTATFGSNVSAGTKLIAYAGTSGNGGFTSVKDGSGNSFTQLGVITGSSGLGSGTALYALDTPAGDVGTKPAITVTVTGGNTDIALLVQEVSGLLPGSTTAMIDGTAATVQTTTTASQAQPSYSSTAAGEFLVALFSDNGGPETFTVPSLYLADVNSLNGSTFADLAVAYKGSTGGAETGTWGFTGTLTGGGYIVVAFKLASQTQNSSGSGRVQWSSGAPVQNPQSGPVFRQATAPVQARISRNAPRGRVYSNAGAKVTALAPPPVYPLQGPVRARLPQQPLLRGRVYSNAGAPVRNPQSGPVFQQATAPIRVRFPQLQPRAGRVYSNRGAPLQNPQAGPAFQQATAPIRARLPQQPLLRGRIYSNQGAPVRNPQPGPVFYPAVQPIRSRIPRVFSKGRVSSNPGAPLQNPQSGPAFQQATSPIRVRIPQNAPRGRIVSNPGGPLVVGGTGPKFQQLPFPARSRIPQNAPRGRVYSNQGAPVRNPQPGPVFQQRTTPVQARIPQTFSKGRVYSTAKPVSQLIITGPPVYPLQGPVRSRIPQVFSKGRVSSNRGAPLQNPQPGPVFVQVPRPVQARILQVFPRGRVYSNPGGPIVVGGTGPKFYPLPFPVRSRVPKNAPRGRIASNPGAPLRNPQSGPVFIQAVHPVQARIPQVFSKGRIYSNAGNVLNPPPPVYPLHGPVRARQPLPVRGRTGSNPGIPVQLPPPVYPLHSPVRSHPVPPPRGRIASNPGTLPPVILIPAPVYPLHGPVRVRIPQNAPRGRISSNPGAPVRNPQSGPVFRQAVKPIRAIIPQNAPRGRSNSNPGGPVANIPTATLRFKYGDPHYRWTYGQPGYRWKYGDPR